MLHMIMIMEFINKRKEILRAEDDGRKKMNKEEFIRRYGTVAYNIKLERDSVWKAMNLDKVRIYDRTWRGKNPEKMELKDHERNRRGGKYYKRKLAYLRVGVPGERHKIRVKHAKIWRKYKKIIAVDSVLHHEWVPGESGYRGIALVEKNQHQHGFIDVIEILAGKITLLLEEKRGSSEWCR